MVRGVLLVCLTSPKPLKAPVSPASSTNGSTLPKFGWLRTFRKVVWNSKFAFSPNLMFLIIEKLAIFVISSRTGLRGELPNGVPNTPCEVLELMMKRTLSLVTGTTAQSTNALMQFGPIAVALSNVVGASNGSQAPVVAPALNRLQASPAMIPTAVAGALRLPRNGRTASTPLLKLPKNPES